MTTRTRLGLGLMLAASLAGGAFFFNIANAQRAEPASAQTLQAAAPKGQTATLLADGRWLLLGGEGSNGLLSSGSVFDPRSGTTTPLSASLSAPRADHTATILPDGSVLIVGGRTSDGVASMAERFDPATQAFTMLPMTGSAPRAGHTATLLTDGRVLLTGGSAGGLEPPATEVWDLQTQTAASLPLRIDRQGHSATLLGDGRVLIAGGQASDGQPPESASSIVDPAAMTVVGDGRTPPPDDAPVVVAASSPVTGARDVPLDARIVVRFSDALRIDTVTPETIRLSGARGNLRTNVVIAEHGRLLFVWPLDSLEEDETYVLTVDGATNDRGVSLVPTTITFTTVSRAPTVDVLENEAWQPSPESGKSGWRSGRAPSPWETLTPLQAPPGVTAVSGRVLRLDGRPLPDVTLEIEGHETRTDRTGRFLLKVEGLGTGEHTLDIDARSANKPLRTYGFYEARILVRAGGTNVLPFTIWSPLIDTAHQVTIASPTLSETVITTPLIPGLELHLPTGTVIRDEDGQVARTVSITPVPLDRTPFPLPADATFSMFFTIQPGGAYLYTPRRTGGWLVYPRVGQSPPGKRVQFFNYDPDNKGWYPYGMGTATATQVVPDAKTRIYAFTGASFNDGTAPPSSGPPPGDCCGNDGDPVNLTTGIFTYEMTDLVVQDVMPLALTRTYASQDTDPSSPRAFGIGMTQPYALFLHSENAYQEADLILPDGGRVHYVRTPESGPSWWQTIFEHTTSPTGFYKSRIAFWGNIAGIGGWELTQKDGTVYVFGHQAPLQAIRDRNGNEIRLTWSDVSAYGSGKGNLLRVTSPNGRWIAFTYYPGTGLVQTASDNIGRTVSYAYDGSGRLWKVTDPLSHVTEYTYDTNHRMTKIKNRNGVEYVTNEYTTTADAPTPVGWVKKQTHADGGVYEFAYDVVNGKSIQTDVKNPRGSIRRTTFNSDGYTLSDTRALATAEEQLAVLTRPATNNFITTSSDSLQQVVYTHDAWGNETSTTRCPASQSPCASGLPNTVTTTYEYEPKFNQIATVTDPLIHTTTFAYDAPGNLASVTDPLQHQTTFTYNAAGQRTSVTDALQHTTHLAHSGGDLTRITDPLNRVTTRFTDSIGRVIAVTDALGQTTRYSHDANNHVRTVTDPAGEQTSFDYFPDGQLQQITDASQHTTAYTYDVMGRLATRTDPLQRVETFGYDLNGNLERWIDRKGQVTTRSYDPLNRVEQITYHDASTIIYSYDDRNRVTQIDDSASGTIVRAYDDLDRLTSETTPEGAITYTDDAADRRATMAVTGQPIVIYSYDDADRLTGITRDALSITLAYDDANRRTSMTKANGVITEYGYDDADQVTALTYRTPTTTLGSLTYGYDAAGQRIELGGTWARTGLPPALVSATYDSANQLTAWGSEARQYDANGSLASDGLTSYLWNSRQRLAATSGLASESFNYDAIGRRVAATVGGAATQYLYDGTTAVSETRGAETTALLAGTGPDEWLARIGPDGSELFLSDILGSTLALTNLAAELENEYTYEPFGTTQAQGSSSGTLRFTGREEDRATSYYYRARYYNPAAGRFISEDPVGLQGGDLNFYVYAMDSPTMRTDPSGELSVGGGVAARVAARTAAGWTAAVVEPTPVGEVAMAVVTTGILLYEIYNAIEKGENYITEQVKARCQRTGEDPCQVLDELMRQAARERNLKLMQDLKQAQKFMGCRRSRQQ